MSNAPINFLPIDRYWFLTWTTYGSWLPGDERGFVGTERIVPQVRQINNQPNTPPSKPNPKLAQFAKHQLKSPVILLSADQARDLLEQFHETTTHRKWLLIAAAVMRTHLHVVVGVTGDPDPDGILRDFKSYGSRRLNRHYGTPASETWWTESGSKRKLSNAASVEAAVNYVRQQPNPLLIWTRDDGFVTTHEGERGGVSPAVVVEPGSMSDSTQRNRPGG